MNITAVRRSLIDYGIVRDIRKFEDDYGGVLLHIVEVYLTDLSLWVNIPTCPAHSSLMAVGGSVDRKSAMRKAIGEAVERYCAAVYDPRAAVVGSYKDLEGIALDPRQFPLFCAEQYSRKDFEFVPFSESATLRWVPAYSFLSRAEILVPAVMVYIPYKLEYPGEKLMIPLASGIACGDSLEKAILKGLYEIIERDAAAVTWFNELPAKRIDYAGQLSDKLSSLVDRWVHDGLELYVNEITTDIEVPTFVCTLLNKQQNGPAATFGLASNSQRTVALEHALEELAMSRWSIRRLISQVDGSQYPSDVYHISGGKDRALFYSLPENVANLDFLLHSTLTPMSRPQFVGHKSADLELAKLVAQLSLLGYDVLVVNLTSPEVASMGLWVTKTIVPGLQPLSPAYGYQHLGGNRLFELPRKLGYQSSYRRETKLNRNPHPFPVQPKEVFA